MRHQHIALLASGFVFAIVTLMHILRLFYHWSVVIGGVIVPEYVSIIGIVFTGILAVWMFTASVCCKRK